MAGLVPGAGGAPGHRRHRLARGPVRPPAGRRRPVPGKRGPQAHRRGGLVRLAGPPRPHHRQPRRRHRPAQGSPAHPAHAGPNPGPGPRARSRGRHRARPARHPHRSASGGPAVHRRPGVRGHRCRRWRPRHRAGAPGAAGHPRQWPTPGPHAPRPGRLPDRRLSRRTGRPDGNPAAIRHPDRGTAVRRRRVAGHAPPRHSGWPASRPDQPPGTAHDAALICGTVPRCRRVTPRPPERHGPRRLAHHPAVRPGRRPAAGAATSASACMPGPGFKFRTVASRQAALPR